MLSVVRTEQPISLRSAVDGRHIVRTSHTLLRNTSWVKVFPGRAFGEFGATRILAGHHQDFDARVAL